MACLAEAVAAVVEVGEATSGCDRGGVLSRERGLKDVASKFSESAVTTVRASPGWYGILAGTMLYRN